MAPNRFSASLSPAAAPERRSGALRVVSARALCSALIALATVPSEAWGQPTAYGSKGKGNGAPQGETGAVVTPVYPFRVVFSAPAGCGSAELFSRQVRRRTQRLKPARADQQGVTFFLYMVQGEGAVRGQLGVGQPDGSLSFREVPGVECNEVIDAMALIAALTFDLAAKTEALPPPPPEAETVEEPREPVAAAAAPLPRKLGFAVAALFGFRSALGPDAAPATNAEASLTFLAGPQRPSLRLGAYLARSAQLEAAAGDARFSLLAARLSGCPTRWSVSENWGVTPCAFVEIGVLEGAGTRIAIPNTTRVFWGAAGLALHSELKVAGPLWLAAEASAFFPMRHESFRFQPDLPENALFQVPSVGGYAALGLGLHFY